MSASKGTMRSTYHFHISHSEDAKTAHSNHLFKGQLPSSHSQRCSLTWGFFKVLWGNSKVQLKLRITAQKSLFLLSLTYMSIKIQ